ncbi:uncharacterized protein LOC116248647 [Nymphaea colorata]|nr:uncharacterized protein LOC116248647 [Nymphaea colorata]
MEESSANYVEAVENSQSNHGWQKVVYHKRQRKSKPENSTSGDTIRANGDKAGNVFRSVEQHAEERRKRVVEAQKASLQAEFLAKPAAAAAAGTSDEDSDAENSHPNGATAAEEKKMKQKKAKKPKVTVAEAASKIDPSNLSAFLVDISGSYQNAPDIQLMRFADYYARAFSAVSSSQFPWTKMFKESPVSKIVDVPLNSIAEDVYKTSVDWIGHIPIDALSDFVLWGLDSIIADLVAHQGTAKGSKKSTQQPSSKAQVAIFLVLAMVLRRKPDALFNLLQTLKTSSKYQGQDKLPVLVWVIAQACQGDIAVGMALWVQILLPLAVGKSSNPHSRDLALQLLERILSSPKAKPVLLNGAVRKGERLVPPAALDLLMQATFPSSSARIKATERFESVYPFLKELALAGSPGSKAMKQVAMQIFPMSFSAISKNNPELSGEAAGIFIWCLSQNSECYKHWEKVYLEQIDRSVVVLTKLSEEWKQHSTRLAPLENMRLTLKNLRLKNEQALNDAESGADRIGLIKDADKLCKALLARLTSRGGCVKTSLLITLAVGVAVYAVASTNPDSWDWEKLSVLFGSPQSI